MLGLSIRPRYFLDLWELFAHHIFCWHIWKMKCINIVMQDNSDKKILQELLVMKSTRYLFQQSKHGNKVFDNCEMEDAKYCICMCLKKFILHLMESVLCKKYFRYHPVLCRGVKGGRPSACQLIIFFPYFASWYRNAALQKQPEASISLGMAHISYIATEL